MFEQQSTPNYCEQNRCYICLEECDTKSKCDCQMYVHERCLAEAHHISKRKNCSICHSAIQVKPFHFFPKPPNVYIGRTEENGVCNSVVFGLCYIFTIYLVFGWLGKLFAYGLGIEIDPQWGAFWTLEHFLAFTISFFIVTAICNIIKKIS